MRIVADRSVMASELFKGATVAELGTFCGDYAAVLLAEAQPLTLHLVDTFESDYVLDGVKGPEAEARVRQRFATQIASGQVELHVQDSLAWMAAQPASSIDAVYIDNVHTRRHVFRELCQAYRVVRPGGYIAGHDYSGGRTPGVVVAVDEFCELHGQLIAVLTDEPEFLLPGRASWEPLMMAYNSFAILVDK